MTVETLLEKLECVKPNHNGWSAKCPAHAGVGDTSLSIAETPDRKILLTCFAMCKTQDIVESLGLRMSDLFPDKQSQTPVAKPHYKVTAEYSYTDVDGTLLYQSLRKECPGFKKKFVQRRPDGNGWAWDMKGVGKVIFNLPTVIAAIASGKPIFIPEGEKDCLSLAALGLTATCNVGGAGKWQDSYSKTLDGANCVILPDNDQPGRDHGQLVARSLQGHAKHVKLVELPGLPIAGDVTDWIQAGGTVAELLQLVKAAKPWEPTAEVEAVVETQEPEQETETQEPGNGQNTQLGNAQLLIAKHGDKIRYNVDAGCWHVYDGIRWAEDKTGSVRRLAADVIDSLYEKLKTTTDSDESRKLLQHILRSKKDSEINGMLNLAKDAVSEHIPVMQAAFDQSPLLFNCGNVTLDLETCKPRPHNPADMLSKMTPVIYDPLAVCERWMQFLGEVFPDQDGKPDVATIKYVQRLSGYFLTSITREQKIWILFGKGGAGKGIFVKTISKVMGEYAAPVMRSAILEKPAGASGSDNQNLTDVVGNRLITCSEFEKQDKLDRGLVKAMSGQDTLKMRRHGQHAFSYQPGYKLLLLTNHIPSFDGAESGMRRRIVVVPFLSKFYEPEEGLCPVADSDLDKKLETELSGILNWMLAGLREYLELGGFGARPQAIKQASAEVLSDQDLLSDWLSDNCNEGRKYSESLKNLWTDYSEWCISNNRQPGFRDTKGFSKNLVSRDGVTKAKSMHGVELQGLALKSSSTYDAYDDNHEILIDSHERLNIDSDTEIGNNRHKRHIGSENNILTWPDLCGYCGEPVEWKPIPDSDQAEYTCKCDWHKVKPISELSDV